MIFTTPLSDGAATASGASPQGQQGPGAGQELRGNTNTNTDQEGVMTFDTRGELAKLREESTFIDDLKENLGIEPKVNLQELFTHWIYRSPGISTRHLVGKAPSSRHGAAYGLLKLWSDPEKGPFHRHPGRGNSIRHFPGPCSPDCQGAKR